MGKSGLLRAFCDRARNSGAVVLALDSALAPSRRGDVPRCEWRGRSRSSTGTSPGRASPRWATHARCRASGGRGNASITRSGALRGYRQAAWHQLRDEVRTTSHADLWRYTADLLYLIENPVVREARSPRRPWRRPLLRQGRRDCEKTPRVFVLSASQRAPEGHPTRVSPRQQVPRPPRRSDSRASDRFRCNSVRPNRRVPS